MVWLHCKNILPNGSKVIVTLFSIYTLPGPANFSMQHCKGSGDKLGYSIASSPGPHPSSVLHTVALKKAEKIWLGLDVANLFFRYMNLATYYTRLVNTVYTMCWIFLDCDY